MTQVMDISLYDYLKSITLDAFFASDTTGKIVDVNEAATVMYGYSRDELLSLRIHDIELQHGHEDIQNRMAKIIAHGYERFESRHSHKDGSIIEVEISVSYVPERHDFLAFHRDITERKRIEEQLKVSEENYRYFTGLTSDYVYKCSRIGSSPYRIKWMAGAVVSICGYTQDEIFEQGCWLPFVHPDDRQKVSTYLFSFLPGDFKKIVYRLVTKSGDIHVVSEKSRCVAGEKVGELILFGATTDITDQRSAEEKRREAQEYFTLFMRYTPVYTFIKQIEGDKSRVIELSDNFIDMLGKPAQELRGRIMEEIFAPEFARKITEDDINVVNANKVIQLDEELHGRNYTTIKFPIIREDKDNLLAGFTIDITERKQAETKLVSREQALASSERFLKTIIDTEPECIKLLDINGNVLMMNQAGLDVTEADSFEQVKGKCLYPLIAEPYRDAFIALTDQVFQGNSGTLEFEIIGHKGRHSWLETRAVPFRDERGEIVSLLGITRDITDIKKNEKALQEGKGLLADIIELSPISMAIVSMDGTIEKINRRAIETFGYSPDEIPDMERWWLKAYPDESYRTEVVAQWMGLVEKAIAEKKEIERREYRVTCKDGTVKTALIFGILVLDKVFVMFDDITDRKNAEAERLKMERQLLHAQKLESLGVLAGGIAHDFNNILMAIVGNADLAKMRLSPESPAIDNIRKIEQSAARAADLAKQMLAYSGRGKFVIETIDLNNLIKEMVGMLEVSISKKVTINYNLVDRLPLIKVDATQIHQILLNLVINASEAIGDSEGIITVSTGPLQCDSAYLHDLWLMDKLEAGLYVCLEVKDTGCGMSREVVGRLFDPFFTTKFTGRGLGMAAVLGIVRGHKGAIKVQSDVGKGTVFKILLPAVGCSDEISIRQENAVVCYDKRTVLLVDDEPIIREVGCEMLQELGYSVVTAEDGRAALEIVRERKDIELIFLDLTMPHMDGIQCLQELRAIVPKAKVIMCSGYNIEEVSNKLSPGDLAGFLQKPFTISDLKAVLSKI